MASSSNNIAVEVLEIKAMMAIIQQKVDQLSGTVNTNKASTPSRTVLPSPSSEADGKDISTPVTAGALPKRKDHQISRCAKRKGIQAESGKTTERPTKKSHASALSTERKESELLYPPNHGNISDLALEPKKFTPEKPNPRQLKSRYSVETDTVDWRVHSTNQITDNQKDLLTMCFRHIRAGSMDPRIVRQIEIEFSQLNKASSRVASKAMVSNDIMQKFAT